MLKRYSTKRCSVDSSKRKPNARLRGLQNVFDENKGSKMNKDQQILNIFNKGTDYASRRRAMLETHQEPEDFGSYCVEEKLRNRHSRLGWMFIDYLRKGSGRKGSNSYSEKSALKRPASLNAVIGDGNTERLELVNVGCGGDDYEAREELKYIQSHLRGKNKMIFNGMLEGRTLKEVGSKLNVSDSRVCQINKELIDKIKFSKLKSLTKEASEWIL